MGLFKRHKRTALFAILISAVLCFFLDSKGDATYTPFNTGVLMNVGIGTSVPGAALQVNNIITFFGEYSNGSQNGSYTINWNNGSKQAITLTGNSTLAFTAPGAGVATFTLRIIQGGSGSYTITWPVGTVKWPGGTAPTLSTAVGAVDIVSCYYNGTNYYCSSAVNFQ